MNGYLKKLLRNVFSVDTEAGYRMRYHITRALACEDYTEEIKFNFLSPRLISVFVWALTSEGHKYWSKIRDLSMARPEYI